MIKIIDGRRYNTKTAEHITGVSQGASGDFAYQTEDLYRTPRGAWFIHGSGGPASSYARPVGNMRTGGSDIRLLTETEALAWLEAHEELDAIERYFSECITDA